MPHRLGPAQRPDHAIHDRLLGLVVEGAVAIRELQAAKRARAAGARGGWLEPADAEFGAGEPDIID